MFVQNLRRRAAGRLSGESESGFTLVELLVVMLILGLLAAIAIPSFFNQRDKATDADAKAAVRTAQTAMETYATDNSGEYTDATADILDGIEETLTDADIQLTDASGTAVTPDAASYSVAAVSGTDNIFAINRASGGTVTYTCTDAGTAGCPGSGGGEGTWAE